MRNNDCHPYQIQAVIPRVKYDSWPVCHRTTQIVGLGKKESHMNSGHGKALTHSRRPRSVFFQFAFNSSSSGNTPAILLLGFGEGCTNSHGLIPHSRHKPGIQRISDHFRYYQIAWKDLWLIVLMCSNREESIDPIAWLTPESCSSYQLH